VRESLSTARSHQATERPHNGGEWRERQKIDEYLYANKTIQQSNDLNKINLLNAAAGYGEMVGEQTNKKPTTKGWRG